MDHPARAVQPLAEALLAGSGEPTPAKYPSQPAIVTLVQASLLGMDRFAPLHAS